MSERGRQRRRKRESMREPKLRLSSYDMLRRPKRLFETEEIKKNDMIREVHFSISPVIIGVNK